MHNWDWRSYANNSTPLPLVYTSVPFHAYCSYRLLVYFNFVISSHDCGHKSNLSHTMILSAFHEVRTCRRTGAVCNRCIILSSHVINLAYVNGVSEQHICYPLYAARPGSLRLQVALFGVSTKYNSRNSSRGTDRQFLTHPKYLD